MEVRPEYKQTEVGVVPVGWDVKQLKSLNFDISDGNYSSKYPKSSDFKQIGISFIRANNVRNMTVSDDDMRFISVGQHRELLKGHLKAGDVLITTRGDIGQIALVPNVHIGSNINAQIVRINTTIQGTDFRYFAYVMISQSSQEQMGMLQTGSALKQLPVGKLIQLWIALPALPEQRAIATALSDVDALLAKLDQFIAKKRDLKQAAMQQLLTGQTRLPGFSGEWEVKPFVEVLSRVNGKAYQIQSSDYQDTGDHPVVDQGKAAVIGFSDRADKVFRCPSGGVIVFGDHTCIVKFVDFDFVVGADGTQIMAGKNEQSARFHAYQLEYSGIPTTGYNRHFKFVKEREFITPTVVEQTAIVNVLSDIDAELTALEVHRDKTRALKQGMMQELLTGRIRLV